MGLALRARLSRRRASFELPCCVAVRACAMRLSGSPAERGVCPETLLEDWASVLDSWRDGLAWLVWANAEMATERRRAERMTVGEEIMRKKESAGGSPGSDPADVSPAVRS